MEEAKKELQARRESGLLNSVTGLNLPLNFPAKPFVAALPHVASATYWDMRFAQEAKEIGLCPFWFEYHSDKFCSSNSEKNNLLTPFFYYGEGRNGGPKLKKIPLVEKRGLWEGKTLREVKTKWGESLINIHHHFHDAIFSDFKSNKFDISSWLKEQGGRAKDYYSHLLSIFVYHGILVDDFHVEDRRIEIFRETVIVPALKQVERLFGKPPLIVRIPWDTHMSWYPGDLEKLLPS